MATVYTFTPKAPSRKRTAVSFNLFHLVGMILLVLVGAFLLFGGYLLVREYREIKRLSLRVENLKQETSLLNEEYTRLTAKEVVLAKAKALGLHPAKPEQIVRLP